MSMGTTSSVAGIRWTDNLLDLLVESASAGRFCTVISCSYLCRRALEEDLARSEIWSTPGHLYLGRHSPAP
jgi:hypothetical protein